MTGLRRNQLAADGAFGIHREPNTGAVVSEPALPAAIVAVNGGIFFDLVFGTLRDVIALVAPFVDHIKAATRMRSADRTAFCLQRRKELMIFRGLASVVGAPAGILCRRRHGSRRLCG